MGRERGPVHQRRAHHGVGPAQAPRRTLDHHDGRRGRVPDRHRVRSTSVREKTADRAPGLSVRLKLTLSYAGFLMVAGTLLLGVAWVFLLRGYPASSLVPRLSNVPRAL